MTLPGTSTWEIMDINNPVTWEEDEMRCLLDLRIAFASSSNNPTTMEHTSMVLTLSCSRRRMMMKVK